MTIGHSVEGRPMKAVYFKGQQGDSIAQDKKPAAMIDGAHHARELITIKMTFSVLLKVLYGVYIGDQGTIKML